jgi:hypothetical protein
MEKFSVKKDGRGLALGFALGIIISMWFGFDILKFKTAGQAESMGRQMAVQSVVQSQAKICATQVNASKDSAALIAKLKGVERYSRGDLVAKSGFATMPGEKEPSSGVPQACAELLVPEQG